MRLARRLQRITGLQARVTVLGYLQRGGVPSATDRLLATQLGTACAELIEKGKYGVMVAVRGEKCKPVSLKKVATRRREVPLDHPWIGSARLVGTSFGDESTCHWSTIESGRLPATALYRRCDPAQFEFETTADVEDLAEIIGQPRAVEAIKFGIGMERKGYNLFAMGPVGTGKAVEFRTDMEQLVKDLRGALSSAFESKEYQTRRQVIGKEFQERQSEALEELQERVRQDGLALVRTPAGFVFAPARNGDVLSPEEMQELTQEESPLSLSASLVFEQSCGGIDGDSASSAELYTLLSAIAEVPIVQSLAVTGSVNQLGQVQAIGGVNAKIEGFFDICQARGLTGEQGVLIPASNVKHLMLRQDVIEAVQNDPFHVYADAVRWYCPPKALWCATRRCWRFWTRSMCRRCL